MKFIIIGIIISCIAFFMNSNSTQTKQTPSTKTVQQEQKTNNTLLEQETRQKLKNIKTDEEWASELSEAKLPSKLEIINHYPKITAYIHVNMVFSFDDVQKMRESVQREISRMPCEVISKYAPLKANHAEHHPDAHDYYTLRKVLSEDHVNMSIIVRDNHQQELTKTTANLSECVFA